MIRISILFGRVICAAIIACGVNPKADAHLNQETTVDGETMLFGRVDRDGFRLPAYKHWFDSTYHAYIPQEKTLELIKPYMENVRIKVFLATWCSDTRRDIPALNRILDDLSYDMKSMKMIALDRSRKSPGHEEAGYNIELVPTSIFFKEGVEMGRIVESPNHTLEEDILTIVTPQP